MVSVHLSRLVRGAADAVMYVSAGDIAVMSRMAASFARGIDRLVYEPDEYCSAGSEEST